MRLLYLKRNKDEEVKMGLEHVFSILCVFMVLFVYDSTIVNNLSLNFH